LVRTLFRLVWLVGAVALAAGMTTATATAAPAGLVAAYGFNEGAGTTAADASGTGNTGTTSSTTWAPLGKYSGALSFNGAGSYVTVNDSASLDLTTGMTLEAWVNPAALGTSGTNWRTVAFKQNTSGMAYALYANNGGARPTGQVNIGGEQNAIGTAQLPLNAWSHLATTYDGATMRLYVNGTQVASKAQTGSIPVTTGPLRIGGNTIWGEYFSGLIDEVRVYNRALTASEIGTDMNTPVAPSSGDSTPPTAQITSPPAGAVSGTVTVAANATDNVGVAGVTFQLDGATLGAEDTSAPYSVAWDTTTAAGGSHTLTAIARDAAGNRTTSAPVSVTVTSTTPQFVNDRVIIGLDEPTAMTFTPDGRMLIAERDGTVWVVQPGATQVSPTPVLQLTNIATGDERGLLGITVDPAFAQNGFIYLYYTHGSVRNRVSRFTMAGNSAPLSSEFVVWANIVDAAIWHQGGDVHFGPDGFLYISVGDHLQSQTAQQLTSYNGKILRVTRDGAIPAGNPFNDGAGPNLDAIWVRGLRNPFRFTIDQPTGRLIIGDVGESSREEVNIGVAGANYGWPVCEGSCGTAGMTNPVYSYAHAGNDASITAGVVYRGTNFPADYRGDFFFGDYAQNWIKRITFDATGNVTQVRNFVPPDGSLDGPYGDIVDFAEGPDGSLWYVDNGPFAANNAGAIRRIRNVNANQPPSAVAAANPTVGPAPLAVTFSSAGSSDPEGRPLTYRWDFGDGTTSTQANPSHTYTTSGRYTARLTTSDGTLEGISNALTITAGAPPVPRILAPTDGATFRAGDVISYSGDATDPQDGAIPPSRLSWKVVFHHDTHIHPVIDAAPGSSGTLTIPTSGHSFRGTTSYEIVLTATDSDGISASRSVTIRPQKVTYTLATTPAGLGLTVDGVSVTAPFVVDELVGFQYVVDAPTPQGNNIFSSWSDGGARSHTVTVPATNQTVTARYNVPLPGLVASYGFNEGTGTTLTDVSGHGHPGTVTGPAWSASGHTGGALAFDGVNDFVSIADQTELDLTTGMTLEAWVNPSALGTSWRTVVFKEQAAHMTYAMYANTSTGQPTGQAYVGGQRDARGPTGLTAGTWTHLATSYDGSTLRLYVNGTQVTALAVSGPMTVSTGPLKLGGNAIWGEWFAGLMDDVRVYNRALTASEVQSEMNTPVFGP
jgi:glucose/arabinose dehydrogenase